MDDKTFAFDLAVSGLTGGQCEALLDLIVEAAEAAGGQVAGGFGPLRREDQEAGDGEAS